MYICMRVPQDLYMCQYYYMYHMQMHRSLHDWSQLYKNYHDGALMLAGLPVLQSLSGAHLL